MQINSVKFPYSSVQFPRNQMDYYKLLELLLAPAIAAKVQNPSISNSNSLESSQVMKKRQIDTPDVNMLALYPGGLFASPVTFNVPSLSNSSPTPVKIQISSEDETSSTSNHSFKTNSQFVEESSPSNCSEKSRNKARRKLEEKLAQKDCEDKCSEATADTLDTEDSGPNQLQGFSLERHAIIPELQNIRVENRPKRRQVKQIWNPDKTNKKDYASYLQGVKKIFQQYAISEEKAIKVYIEFGKSSKKALKAIQERESYYRRILKLDYSKCAKC